MSSLLPGSLQLLLITAVVPRRSPLQGVWQEEEHMSGGWEADRNLFLSVECFIRVHVAMYVKQVPWWENPE